MYSSTVGSFADIGAQKIKALQQNLPAFLIGAAMAGAYVGFGGIVMFSVGAHLGPEWSRLIMGAVFASALTIVVFAGAELFTGAVMYLSFAALRHQVRVTEVLTVWVVCWIGNLLGAIVLALLLHMAGGGVLLGDGAEVFYKFVSAKMSANGAQLFARGLLCNWLVCLSLWMCSRTKSDAAKLGLIFWPVMLFASSGFEHSVANMFIFAMALLGPEHAGVSLSGAVHNLVWVTLGNIAGGAVMVAIGYWLQSASATRVVRPVITTATSRDAHEDAGAESLKHR